jgi:hypothetical protein
MENNKEEIKRDAMRQVIDATRNAEGEINKENTKNW